MDLPKRSKLLDFLSILNHQKSTVLVQTLLAFRIYMIREFNKGASLLQV